MTQVTPGITAKTQLLNQQASCQLLKEMGAPVSLSTFLNGVKTGKYPQPIRITPRRPVWRAQDLFALVAAL